MTLDSLPLAAQTPITSASESASTVNHEFAVILLGLAIVTLISCIYAIKSWKFTATQVRSFHKA